jgi:N-acetylneuraminic acid mutarotase
MVGDKRVALILMLVLCSVLVSLPNIAAVRATEDSWITLESMPTARTSLGVAVVDGKIYAIGGYNGSYLAVNEMYDPAADTWITKEPMPTPRHSFGIAVYQNKIYLFGGKTRSSDSESSGITGGTEVYDPSTDTWETKTSMPTPRSSLCASAINNKIYLIGGAVYTNQNPPFYNSTNINEMYNPETDTWTTKTGMPGVLHDYVSAVVENKIYLFGGVLTVAGPWPPNLSSANRIYNSETDTWTSGESMPTLAVDGVCGATTGVLAPKRIYVIGGWNGLEIHGSNMTQIYDPETDEWSSGSPMPTPRDGMGIAVVNDILYVIGGSTGSGILGDEVTRLAINEKYTPAGYIPEFPSWTPLLFTFIALVVVLAVYRRKLRKTYSVKELTRKNSLGRAQRNS